LKKVGIISQARMTSTRLPGKIMLEAKGKPMLQYHVERLQWSGYPVIIATTTNRTDDAVALFCKKYGLTCVRGEEQNVLSRYYQAALQEKLDVIVRVTSDCPLIDGRLIRRGAEEYAERFDSRLYYSNALQRSYPRGFDFEIFSFELLEEAYKNAILEPDLEHVTPYINQNKAGTVRFKHLVYEKNKSQYRVTLDESDDFQLLKTLIEEFQVAQKDHGEIIKLLDEHPELVAMNAHVEQKKYGQ